MTYKVSFGGFSMVIEAGQLDALLEVVLGEVTVQRMPEDKTTVTMTAKPEGKRRGRPPKATVPVEERPVEERPVEESETTVTMTVNEKNEMTTPKTTEKPSSLLQRFTRLTDKDYDKAAKLLEAFDYARFSDLKAKDYDAFSVALTEAGF